jgi:ankyrin repeat protein
LVQACVDGADADVRELLDAGANQARTDDGATPLFIACNLGHAEIVQMLLKHDGVAANQATTDDGTTPLYVACNQGHAEIVQMLLEHEGVAANQARTDTGATPLYTACNRGHAEIVRALLMNGAISSINQAVLAGHDGLRPLHHAVLTGNLAMAQLLLVFGADRTATTLDGETPREVAISQEQPLLAEWLGAVAEWPKLRIAAGCRLHRDVATQLKLGMIDPDTLSVPEIRTVIETAAAPPTELPWTDAPDVCRTTARLIKAAFHGWAPPRHWLYHVGFRTAVHSVLLVGERLHRRLSMVPAPLPIIPPEMWIAVVSFCLRRNWTVEGVVEVR